MTWMAFTEDGTPISGSDHEDDPAMCMLYLMRYMPEKVATEYVEWINMRDARAEAAVRSLFDPVYSDALKERFLDFVAHYIEEKGSFEIMGSNYWIKQVDTEGEE